MSAAARPGVSLHRGADVVHAAAMSFPLAHHLTTSSPAPHHHEQQQLALAQQALEQQGCTVADDRLSLNHHALASPPPPPHDIPLSLRPAVQQTSVYTVCRLSVKHYTNNTRAFQFAIRFDSIRFDSL